MKEKLLENKKKVLENLYLCGVLPVFLYVDNNFLGVMARFFCQ